MPYTPSSLVAIGFGPALTAGQRRSQLFFYRTADAQATIAEADYFLPSVDVFDTGDVIIAVGASGATETLTFYVVQTRTATGITTSKQI